MFNEYTFFYTNTDFEQFYTQSGIRPVNDFTSIEYSIMISGNDLVINDDRELISGHMYSIDIAVDYGASYEAEGLIDGLVDQTVFEPVDLAGFTLPPLVGGLFFGAIIPTLSSPLDLDLLLETGVRYDLANGSDDLWGTNRADRAFLDGEGRSAFFRGGDDFVTVGYDAGDMRLTLGRGNDNAFGGSGDDIVFGNAGQDYLYGDAGDDALYGGAGRDSLSGGNGNDRLFGGAGNDDLSDGFGSSFLYGNKGADLLQSIGDGSKMFGGNGADVLATRGQNTIMTGGRGEDTFVFLFGGPEQVDDTRFVIRDFSQGADTLSFKSDRYSSHTIEESFELFTEYASQAGDNVVMRDDDWTLVIRNSDLSDFTLDDFIDGYDALG